LRCFNAAGISRPGHQPERRVASGRYVSRVEFPPKTVAAIDCAFSRDNRRIGAIIVVLEYPALRIVEAVHAVREVDFPYISGLLSFREAPVCIRAAKKLKTTPDIFLIDGQGIAHPRRLGLASHLGLFLDRPTIGCAKSRLIGQFEPPPAVKGSYSLLTDRNETIGAVLRSRSQMHTRRRHQNDACLHRQVPPARTIATGPPDDHTTQRVHLMYSGLGFKKELLQFRMKMLLLPVK